MPNNINQSAIAEVADQLFLDTADDGRLTVVTNNLGLNRPIIKYSDDDYWRAVAKQIALTPKLTFTIMERVLELCFGPKKSRISNISNNADIGANIIYVNDASKFVQVGTIVLDKGTANEETLDYRFVDLYSNALYLKLETAFSHALRNDAADYLKVNALATSTSLQLFDSSLFPTSGFPYTIIVDRGTAREETVTVSANNLLTNTLTCSATGLDHFAPQPQFAKTELFKATVPGRDFLVFNTDDTRVFPNTGWVIIDKNNVGEEALQYDINDLELNTLFLSNVTGFSHVVGAPVDLALPGATIELAGAIEFGTNWDLFQTENKKITIFIPDSLNPQTIRDSAHLHGEVPPVFATTLAAGVSPTDTVLKINSDAGFPDEAGIAKISTQFMFFILRGINSLLTSNISVGVSTLTVENSTQFPSTFNAKIDPGLATEETVTITFNDTSTGILTLSSGTTFPHSYHSIVAITPTELVLDRPVGNSYLSGAAVGLVRFPYAGTSLEDGNMRSGGSFVLNYQFSGPYIYDLNQQGVNAVVSSLNSGVPFSVEIAFSQSAGRTSLEIFNAHIWDLINPDNVKIGINSGFEETKEVFTWKRKVTTGPAAVDVGGGTIGDLFIKTDAAISAFPTSGDSAPLGYRILIDQGGANEEIVTVEHRLINPPSPDNRFTLLTPLTKNHIAVETIELVNDVVTFTLPLTRPHAGPSILPSRFGDIIQPLVSQIDLVSASSFPLEGDKFYINFGKEKINNRNKIVSIPDATHIIVQDSSKFPITSYPYPLIVGEGTLNEELVFVTLNNPAFPNRFTLQAPGMLNSHVVDDYVSFTSGDPEVIEYVSKSGNTLILQELTALNTGHLVGENVILSKSISEPNSDGSSFSFYIPPDPQACFEMLLDLLRAAGVQIVTTNHH